MAIFFKQKSEAVREIMIENCKFSFFENFFIEILKILLKSMQDKISMRKNDVELGTNACQSRSIAGGITPSIFCRTNYMKKSQKRFMLIAFSFLLVLVNLDKRILQTNKTFFISPFRCPAC